MTRLQLQDDAVGQHHEQDHLLLHVRARQHGGRGREGRDQEEVAEPVREEAAGPVQHADNRAGHYGQPEQSQDGQDDCAQNNNFFSQATQ